MSGHIPAALLLATERWCTDGQHYVSALRFPGPLVYVTGRRGSRCRACQYEANRWRRKVGVATQRAA